MKRSGVADLPLHGGRVPAWLASRMSTLGTAIAESVLLHYGRTALLSRLSDPFWFQALGSVMGMDWHSSGITTSVMSALKKGLNPRAHELGIHICGGRGTQSLRTPDELRAIAERTGLDGQALVRTSRLTARVDNNAVADGFQIYLHSFILTADGEWAVVQQGMNEASRLARRYHWHSAAVRDFTSAPHTAIVGEHTGTIMNLVDREARPAQDVLLAITRDDPARTIADIRAAFAHGASAPRRLEMPVHHDVRAKDVNEKRLGAVLALAHERDLRDFASLLLLEQLGPRTLQSLALIAEVVHGTPTRFDDPARFAFAHGGKDGHPFPVPLKIYDESIAVLRRALDSAKLGHTDRLGGLKRLDAFTRAIEGRRGPEADVAATIAHERRSRHRSGAVLSSTIDAGRVAANWNYSTIQHGRSPSGAHHAPAKRMRAVCLALVALAAGACGMVEASKPSVEVDMRNVDLHITPEIDLHIRHLRGRFIASGARTAPYLDDPRTYTVVVDTGDVAVDLGSLNAIVNRALEQGRSNVQRVEISIDTDGHLHQKGVVKKGISVPFDMKASIGVTPDGLIRIHSEAMKGFGVPVNPLLEVLRLQTDDLIRIDPGHGIRVERNDLLLDVSQLLPPPGFRGKLTSVRVERNALIQVFGSGEARAISPAASATNHIYWRGGQLAFGKLTMTDTDLELVDEDPRDPFDFSVDRWNEPLVAGYSKTTSSRGLRAHMPDFNDLHR